MLNVKHVTDFITLPKCNSLFCINDLLPCNHCHINELEGYLAIGK